MQLLKTIVTAIVNFIVAFATAINHPVQATNFYRCVLRALLRDRPVDCYITYDTIRDGRSAPSCGVRLSRTHLSEITLEAALDFLAERTRTDVDWNEFTVYYRFGDPTVLTNPDYPAQLAITQS